MADTTPPTGTGAAAPPAAPPPAPTATAPAAPAPAAAAPAPPPQPAPAAPAPQAASVGPTLEQHQWASQFCRVDTNAPPAGAAAPSLAAPAPEEPGGFFSSISHAVGSAVSAVGHAASSAVTAVEGAVSAVANAPSLGALADKAVQGVIDGGASLAEKAVSAAPLPQALKDAATTYVHFEKGVAEGVYHGVKGLASDAVAAGEMVSGVGLVKGAVRLGEAVVSEDARNSLVKDVKDGLGKAAGIAKMGVELVTNPVGAGMAIGKQVGDGYSKAAAEGKGAEYLGKGVGEIGVAIASIAVGGEAGEAAEAAKAAEEALAAAKAAREAEAAAAAAKAAEEAAAAAKAAEEAAAAAKAAKEAEEAAAAEKAAKEAEAAAAKAAERARRLPPDKVEKILTGERVPNPASPNGLSNEVIGGHSPRIKSMPDYEVEELAKNADGTSNVKFTKQFPDGNLSRLKKSTLAPDAWTDQMIEDATQAVADAPAVATRARDGATLHREVIDGVQWEVIRDKNGLITSSYPTGGTPTATF